RAEARAEAAGVPARALRPRHVHLPAGGRDGGRAERGDVPPRPGPGGGRGHDREPRRARVGHADPRAGEAVTPAAPPRRQPVNGPRFLTATDTPGPAGGELNLNVVIGGP